MRRSESTCGSGTFVYGPRGIPHGFRVEGEQPARVLLQCTPGGFEHFVMEMSEQAPPSGPPDMQRLISVAAKYGNEILGPLPERQDQVNILQLLRTPFWRGSHSGISQKFALT